MKRHINSFRLSWFGLVLFLLTAVTPKLNAASAAETKAMESARMAFEDHAWDRAESEFGNFVKKYPASEQFAEAVLYQARARLEQAPKNPRKYDDAIALLSAQQVHAGKLADQFIYWTARTYFEGGNYQAAADTYARLIKDFPDSNTNLRLEAAFREADAHARMNDAAGVIERLNSPDKAFQKMAGANMDNDFARRGFLLLAESELGQGNYPTAQGLLDVLGQQKMPSELEWRRRCLLSSVQLAAGRAEDALQTSTNLLEVAGSDPDLKARSMVMQGQIREHLMQYPEAIKTYEANLADDVPAKWQREALLRIVELTLQQNKTDEAARRLEDFLTKHPKEAGTDFVLLSLGELRLKQYTLSPPETDPSATNYLRQARESFEKLLNTHTNSEYAGKAQLNLGWCLLAEGKAAESQITFSRAVGQLKFSEDQAIARFKLGDALFQQTNYPGAISNYNLVVGQYGSLTEVKTNLFEQAYYQIERAGIEENNLEVATDAMNKMRAGFPGGKLEDQGMLLLGQALNRGRSFGTAREWLSKLLAKMPESPLAPQAKLAMARTYEGEGDWANAISQYEAWETSYPNDPALPSAEFSLALAKSGAGMETNAFSALTNFVAQFPTNELTPQAQFWIGNYFLNHDRYQEAESSFQEVYDHTSQHASQWTYQAQMMAGYAAVARQNFKEAIGYFSRLVKEADLHPELGLSNLVLEASFACGDAYMDNAAPNHFSDAKNWFLRITTNQPVNNISLLAWARLGDCYRQLATNDPASYGMASNAYQKVIDSKIDPSLRSKAEWGLAMTLEDMARTKSPPDRDLLELSLTHYENILYGNNLTEDEKGDLIWVGTAGLEAGRLAEDLHEWDHAARLYERLGRLLPQWESRLESRKARVRKYLEQLSDKNI